MSYLFILYLLVPLTKVPVFLHFLHLTHSNPPYDESEGFHRPAITTLLRRLGRPCICSATWM